MSYKVIDMNTYKRRKHFDYFNHMGLPYVGVTANVNITSLIKTLKENKYPFFYHFAIV